MNSIPDGNLDSIAAAMLGSAAHVLSALLERDVIAGEPAGSQTDASLRVDDEWTATSTEIPSLAATFVSRYQKADLARIVGIMVGHDQEGEMDAMQLSIVAETVAQVSNAMGEQIAQAVDASTDGIASHVVSDTASFPPPPYRTYQGYVQIGGEINILVSVDFDGLMLSRLASPPQGAVASAGASPAAAAAAQGLHVPPTGGMAHRPQTAAQPAQFAPMQPTPIHSAALGHANLDLVHDIPLQISAVLGQTALPLRDVVALQAGSVFELDKLSTDPIDLFVNNILIARGEVVVVDDKYAVKISELNPSHERV